MVQVPERAAVVRISFSALSQDQRRPSHVWLYAPCTMLRARKAGSMGHLSRRSPTTPAKVLAIHPPFRASGQGEDESPCPKAHSAQ